ncbi:hypothetical protein QNH47_12665 [Virgibacillus halodenitrificans]|uniref:hypothetical protein n=1 Tax=Virgibacillus halodenitrificans TaxID=1482 RepID=UPI0024BFAD13|nr:hypothetical protein [Virgibacillus halodenitrificans]WHX25020.1 hypothetical protein QNH47_12665 [Virgibacillus halodenitrificans]
MNIQVDLIGKRGLKMERSNHKSSQTGKVGRGTTKKFASSLYPNMFIQDFCQDFSISFSDFNSRENFFKTDSTLLRELLEYDDYGLFRYDFSKLLSNIVHDLIFKGQSYIETVLYFDDTNELVGIKFFPLNYIIKFPALRRKLFLAKSYNNSLIYFYVYKKRIIKFNLNDISLTKKTFIKLLDKISRLGSPGFDLVNRIPNFDFERYARYEDFKLLKYTKGVYWNGRKYDNRFVNEPYSLYRLTNYTILRLTMLKYLLCKINTSIKNVGDEFNFQGEIECKFDIDEKIAYLKSSYEKFVEKEINQEQLINILISKE